MESSNIGILNHCCVHLPAQSVYLAPKSFSVKSDRSVCTTNCKKPCGFALLQLKLLKKRLCFEALQSPLNKLQDTNVSVTELVKLPDRLCYMALQKNLQFIPQSPHFKFQQYKNQKQMKKEICKQIIISKISKVETVNKSGGFFPSGISNVTIK